MTDAGWLEDPSARDELRYWDGTAWTKHVWTAGVQGVRPLAPHEREEAFRATQEHPSVIARRRLTIAIAVLLLLVLLLLLMVHVPAGTR